MSKQILTNFVETIVLKNDVDMPQELMPECSHSDIVGLTLFQLLDKESIRIGIPAANSGGSHPQCFPQTGSTPLENVALCALKFSGGEDSRVSAGKTLPSASHAIAFTSWSMEFQA